MSGGAARHAKPAAAREDPLAVSGWSRASKHRQLAEKQAQLLTVRLAQLRQLNISELHAQVLKPAAEAGAPPACLLFRSETGAAHCLSHARDGLVISPE